ncbi:MAG TPA: hypothetical protein VG841_03255 [Caulobacterales bacterium]|nr:hypothetical protein [Caulobacterales bacterium]
MASLGAHACDRAPAPAATPPPPVSREAAAAPVLWFICDAIDAPAVLVVRKDARGRALIEEYDKQRSAQAPAQEFELGASEGAAGSVYTALMRDGAQVGFVRALNPGVLETPAAAYTTPYTSLGIGDRRIACRWMARTRLIGFTARRSFAVTEDADGDLIYTTFNFDDAGSQRAIDLSDSQRSTTFSLEVRGGEEKTTPEASDFRFMARGYAYLVHAPKAGAPTLSVLHNGALVQTEPILAVQTGAGGEPAP